MKRIFLAILFILVCLAAILGGFYAYLGWWGTKVGREDSIARAKYLWEPGFVYRRTYLTEEDLGHVPEHFAEQYRGSAKIGYVLATQGDWDRTAILCQSLLLFSAGVGGLISLKRPQVDD